MTIIKSFISAFSTFSKIPMPKINYQKNDARFMLLFFPFIGIFIGFIEYLWFLFSNYFNLSQIGFVIGQLLIPIIITGGIHIDGFMDCMDAFSSYQPPKKKLEILKDPHIGAFSVIRLVELIGILLICLCNIDESVYLLAIVGFVASRILSAICIIRFPQAKETGMVAYTKSQASTACFDGLIIELLLIIIFIVFYFKFIVIYPLLASIITVVLYRFKAIKNFGGITGDTAGCFLVMYETTWIFSLFIYCLAGRL